jgi:ribulose kinase
MSKKSGKAETIEIACPCCNAVLKIDTGMGAVISHVAAVKPKMFADLETAAQAMREHDTRKESIFRQSVEAEKHKSELLDKKFQEAFKKAKDEPDRPLIRDIDLD